MTRPLWDFKDPREALKALEKRRDEIIAELETLEEKKGGELSEEEFVQRRTALEREFVEVMDRIMQLRFIVSGGF